MAHGNGWLQWSRGLTPRINEELRRVQRAHSMASMEPRLDAADQHWANLRHLLSRDASMEPRLDAADQLPVRQIGRIRDRASMEPRLDAADQPGVYKACHVEYHDPSTLQWSRGLTPRINDQQLQAMQTAMQLQWSRGLTPRINLAVHRLCTSARLASMEPRLDAADQLFVRFESAKDQGRGASMEPRLDAADQHQSPALRRTHPHASMEPRLDAADQLNRRLN
ncbi:hypothetical protein SAMN05421543_12148 [Alicyclobacillus macrosporangiidus]|uniref:Uncharacterized protein n=1 Tax=Alicyclobacillus macrosporangiidus TaxID=392015 RepID=A0A1I7KZ24_9BACL|nr:hypothetical protein SAMN05421543_12148 [Alicyclobacillus macrosporangiidus]